MLCCKAEKLQVDVTSAGNHPGNLGTDVVIVNGRWAATGKCKVLFKSIYRPPEPIPLQSFIFRVPPSFVGLAVQSFALGKMNGGSTQTVLKCRAARAFNITCLPPNHD